MVRCDGEEDEEEVEEEEEEKEEEEEGEKKCDYTARFARTTALRAVLLWLGLKILKGGGLWN